jgi:hypothetical protein
MPRQSTPRHTTIAAKRRTCPVCDLPSVVVETCSCCAQEWMVCHECGLALTRVA